jgi:hypothetical protein
VPPNDAANLSFIYSLVEQTLDAVPLLLVRCLYPFVTRVFSGVCIALRFTGKLHFTTEWGHRNDCAYCDYDDVDELIEARVRSTLGSVTV